MHCEKCNCYNNNNFFFFLKEKNETKVAIMRTLLLESLGYLIAYIFFSSMNCIVEPWPWNEVNFFFLLLKQKKGKSKIMTWTSRLSILLFNLN